MKDYSGIKMEHDGDIIFVTVAKYKLFMAYGKIGMDAYCLYSHMIFTARLQETNQIYANDTYLRGGLGWSREKTQKAKALLFDLGLVEEITRREKGKFCGKYLKIKTTTTPFEIVSINQPCDGKPADGKAACGESTVNALTNNINSLTKKESVPSETHNSETYKQYVNKLYTLSEKINNTKPIWTGKEYNCLKQLLLKAKDKEKLDSAIERLYVAKMNHEKKYDWIAFSPSGILTGINHLLNDIGGLSERDQVKLEYGTDKEKSEIRERMKI